MVESGHLSVHAITNFNLHPFMVTHTSRPAQYIINDGTITTDTATITIIAVYPCQDAHILHIGSILNEVT